MYPTLFKIPHLPEWLADIKSFGIMMMIGFLAGIWLACRRAYRVQGNPDTVLNVGFLALIFGVVGARIMFVLHYWDTHFANRPNPILAVFDIRAGGLEFWGGPLLVIPVVIIYLRYIARVSTRWYLDMVVPSLAFGIGVIRVGCFLNGCCWGSVCTAESDPHHDRAAYPWAVHFPYGSAPMIQQYSFGQLSLPKELIYVQSDGESRPVPIEYIQDAVGDGGKTRRRLEENFQQTTQAYDEAKGAGKDGQTLAHLRAQQDAASKTLMVDFLSSPLGLIYKQCQNYKLTPEQTALWVKASEPLVKTWAEGVKKTGVDADAAMTELRASLKKYDALAQ